MEHTWCFSPAGSSLTALYALYHLPQQSKVKAERNKRKDALKDLRARLKTLKDKLKDAGDKDSKLKASLEGDIEKVNKEIDKMTSKVSGACTGGKPIVFRLRKES